MALRESQARVLAALAQSSASAWTVRELVARTGLSMNTVRGVARALVARGLARSVRGGTRVTGLGRVVIGAPVYRDHRYRQSGLPGDRRDGKEIETKGVTH